AARTFHCQFISGRSGLNRAARLLAVALNGSDMRTRLTLVWSRMLWIAPTRGMMRRVAPLATALCVCLVCAAPAIADPKPNVIVFLADDMGIGDTSAYLNQKLSSSSAPIDITVKTSNLERLAQNGRIFTDSHSPSSMCSTS